MIRLSFILAVFLCFTTSLVHAAGFQIIEVPADGPLTAPKGGIWSPCTRPASEVKLGPVVMSVAKDCPISGDKLPLVVISHGRGGTFVGHSGSERRRKLETYLYQAERFILAAYSGAMPG